MGFLLIKLTFWRVWQIYEKKSEQSEGSILDWDRREKISITVLEQSAINHSWRCSFSAKRQSFQVFIQRKMSLRELKMSSLGVYNYHATLVQRISRTFSKLGSETSIRNCFYDLPHIYVKFNVMISSALLCVRHFCEFVPRTNDRKSGKETQWSFPTAGREHSLTKALFTHCVKRNQFVIVRSLCVMTSTKSVYLPHKFITTFNRCKQQNPFKRHSISLVKSCNMVNKNSLIFAPRRCKLKNRASTEIQRHRFPVAEVLSISSLLSSSFHIFLEISIFFFLIS